MKRPLAVLSFAALLATALPAAGAQIASVGKPAPQFSFTSLDGNRLTLQKFAGQPIFINFFATWCPPCKLELPNIVKSYPAYKGRVVFLGLDQQESPDLVKPFLKQYSIRYLVGVDEGQVGADFGIGAIPESVFIDRHGIVRAIWRGYMPPSVFTKNMALIDR
ncbi:MAG: TlpA family protein disulfide reductase [Candidatus Eremiobacteraeota bacterium]|nr:TlpA family protein disulfide reductase [Candidatus Eremiobacteraeota bacterium]